MKKLIVAMVVVPMIASGAAACTKTDSRITSENDAQATAAPPKSCRKDNKIDISVQFSPKWNKLHAVSKNAAGKGKPKLVENVSVTYNYDSTYTNNFNMSGKFVDVGGREINDVGRLTVRSYALQAYKFVKQPQLQE